MSQPRLALMVSSLRAGGSERVMTRLANDFIEHGADIHVLTLDDDRDPPAYPLHNGVKLHRLGLEKQASGPLAAVMANIGRHLAIKRALSGIHPSMVISFGTVCNVLAAAARSSQWSTVISERLVPGVYAESPTWSRLRKISYGRANLHVTQTDWVADWSKREWPQLATRVIPNPVDVPAAVMPVLEREDAIVCVGRMSHEKGHDILLRAFAQVAPVMPNWRLCFVGDGPLRKDYEALAEQLNIVSRVEFLGLQSNVLEHLERCKLFVLPSRNEGFPNALLEAMAMGCAVIASDCPAGPREILKNGGGRLFESESIQSLSEAIRESVLPNALMEIAESARLAVLRYESSQVLAQWRSLWQSSAPNSLAAVSLPDGALVP